MVLQVGVKVFLENPERKYLLFQRSAKYGGNEGEWDIPGGRIEVGVDLVSNLKRELEEESGRNVILEDLRLIAAQDILRLDKHVVRLTYRATTPEQFTVPDGEEHKAFGWFSKEELSTLPNVDRFSAEVLRNGLLN